jgi:hypothetical protein
MGLSGDLNLSVMSETHLYELEASFSKIYKLTYNLVEPFKAQW